MSINNRNPLFEVNFSKNSTKGEVIVDSPFGLKFVRTQKLWQVGTRPLKQTPVDASGSLSLWPKELDNSNQCNKHYHLCSPCRMIHFSFENDKHLTKHLFSSCHQFSELCETSHHRRNISVTPSMRKMLNTSTCILLNTLPAPCDSEKLDCQKLILLSKSTKQSLHYTPKYPIKKN